MALTKITYTDYVTVIGANNLNAIQDEIIANGENISQAQTDIANRYTKSEVDAKVDVKAPIDSPTFTGTPTAPTPTEGDSSTKIATTAFVQGISESLEYTTITDTEIEALFENI